MSEEKFTFNGVNGATGASGVPTMTGVELANIIKGEEPPENQGELKAKQAPGAFPIKPPNDPSRLDQAGWAVIFGAKDKTTPAVKEALSDLLTLRQAQAGERFQIYEKGAGYRPGETKGDFFKRHKVGRGPADPEQMPYYVMIVGSPDDVPFGFQYQLDAMRGVGRIHFDTPEEYAQYARNVVLAETGHVKLPRQATFFGVNNPDDAATDLSTKYLIGPLHEKMKQKQPFGRTIDEGGGVKREIMLDWQFEQFVAEQATKAQLAKLFGGDQTPAVLFTASHGMEFPLNDPRQVAHQGALLCQDWPGPNQWRGEIPQDLYFAGDDLTSDTNVLGLVALLFACFGAGTPQLDQFAKQAFKDEREQIAPHNFIGGLPKRLLLQGALAVVGHVERAWGYSIDASGADETGVFEDAMRALLSGDRVGWITESMNLRYAALATELTTDIEESEWDEDYIDDYDLAQKWTMHNDARGYVVIGDPAVQSPVALPTEREKDRPALDTTVDLSAYSAPLSGVVMSPDEELAKPDDISETDWKNTPIKVKEYIIKLQG
ncbi:MAG: hypothetical protein GY832_23335 [Chloroflexi bacterium]|nr:hypothetical protein [Chloroflexota bacterium]